jgi:hypothetical protein
MKLRLWLIPLATLLYSPSIKAVPYSDAPEIESTDVIDPEFLDGFIGVGGGATQHLTESNFTEEDRGLRQYAHLEFTRLRRWIALDVRAGFGQDYNDYGLLFKVYKHWRFSPKNSTGLSLGAGVGAMYSPKKTSTPSEGTTITRYAFVDLIGAPFARYMWD